MKNITGYIIAGILAVIMVLTIVYCAIAAGIVGLFGYFVIVTAGSIATVKTLNRIRG